MINAQRYFGMTMDELEAEMHTADETAKAVHAIFDMRHQYGEFSTKQQSAKDRRNKSKKSKIAKAKEIKL